MGARWGWGCRVTRLKQRRRSPPPRWGGEGSIQHHEPRHIAARQVAHVVERRRVGQRVKFARLRGIHPHFAIIAQIFGMDRIAGGIVVRLAPIFVGPRSEEHTSEIQSLMRISYAVFCLKKKNKNLTTPNST